MLWYIRVTLLCRPYSILCVIIFEFSSIRSHICCRLVALAPRRNERLNRNNEMRSPLCQIFIVISS